MVPQAPSGVIPKHRSRSTNKCGPKINKWNSNEKANVAAQIREMLRWAGERDLLAGSPGSMPSTTVAPKHVAGRVFKHYRCDPKTKSNQKQLLLFYWIVSLSSHYPRIWQLDIQDLLSLHFIFYFAWWGEGVRGGWALGCSRLILSSVLRAHSWYCSGNHMWHWECNQDSSQIRQGLM